MNFLTLDRSLEEPNLVKPMHQVVNQSREPGLRGRLVWTIAQSANQSPFLSTQRIVPLAGYSVHHEEMV